jgi:hypothetical protein
MQLREYRNVIRYCNTNCRNVVTRVSWERNVPHWETVPVSCGVDYFTTLPICRLHSVELNDKLRIGTDLKRSGRGLIEVLSQY